MVNNYIFRSLSIGSIVLSSVLFFVQSESQAAGKRYFCAVLNGTYKTFAVTNRGKIPIINWVRSTADLSSRERCIIGSQRFQSFSERGMLKYISTGTVNRESVLCAVNRKGDSCHSGNVLVTLPKGSNATETAETARKMLDISSLASGRIINVNGGEKLESYVNDRYYFSVESIEEIAKPETEEIIPIE
jgi:hypothetical protein